MLNGRACFDDSRLLHSRALRVKFVTSHRDVVHCIRLLLCFSLIALREAHHAPVLGLHLQRGGIGNGLVSHIKRGLALATGFLTDAWPTTRCGWFAGVAAFPIQRTRASLPETCFHASPCNTERILDLVRTS